MLLEQWLVLGWVGPFEFFWSEFLTKCPITPQKASSKDSSVLHLSLCGPFVSFCLVWHLSGWFVRVPSFIYSALKVANILNIDLAP